MDVVASRILTWFDQAERAFPFRGAHVTPWGIYVSEVMAQQTQITRVASEWPVWMERWPTPAALAASSPADVVRAWGSLGYPRRALWLHAAATQMVERHGGEVPQDAAALRALPGVGEYTAAAVRALGFGVRTPVVDVNVRRVHARVFDGVESPAGSVTNAEREHHERFLPADAALATRLGQAVLDLGATVCTARLPKCDECPVADLCAWRSAGQPPATRSPRRQAKFEGSDRQCRGALLRVLRGAIEPVPESALEHVWSEALQRNRCLAGLMDDGLVVRDPSGHYALPS